METEYDKQRRDACGEQQNREVEWSSPKRSGGQELDVAKAEPLYAAPTEVEFSQQQEQGSDYQALAARDQWTKSTLHRKRPRKSQRCDQAVDPIRDDAIAEIGPDQPATREQQQRVTDRVSQVCHEGCGMTTTWSGGSQCEQGPQRLTAAIQLPSTGVARPRALAPGLGSAELKGERHENVIAMHIGMLRP